MNKDILQNMIWSEIKILKKIFILFGENNIFFVGGVVRNLLLKKPIEDIDLAVKFNTEEVKEKLKKNQFQSILQFWSIKKSSGVLRN